VARAAIVSSSGLYNKLLARRIMPRFAALFPLFLIHGPLQAEEPPVAAESELRDLVDRYSTDLDALSRRYPVESSPERFERLARYYDEWKARVEAVAFEPLGVEGRIDHLLLRNEIDYEKRLLSREEDWLLESSALLPFAEDALALNDARLRMDPMDAAKAGAALDSLAKRIDAARKEREGRVDGIDRLAAFRAQEQLGAVGEALRSWYEFYSGYDPLFTWWCQAPYKEVTRALEDYRKFLHEKVLGIEPGADEPIVGTPIGRDALVADLASELVPYTPEELLVLAEREFQWCENELRKAARDMGLGDDSMAAIEKVKNLYVPPGEQPNLIRDLAREAEAYLDEHGLLSVPPLAKEVWRMRMMTPERQKVNPFFTGGEVISVSYPTDTMDHQDKLMSLRGNNIHFARATVFHELIPGHHLQAFMNQRYNAHRRAFRTPFWGEGWALYWEMLLWDRGFQRSPEDRVGMLFWRMHRAARIVFSLGFHLGRMTPEECIELLVERGGHELANAAAEVRRSFNGSYPPLYQLAYMMGGLQFRALHEEMVASGKMTDREFHDAVLEGGSMPVEMVRVRLRKEAIHRDYRPTWKFLGQEVSQ
jgi:hypothetical protein